MIGRNWTISLFQCDGTVRTILGDEISEDNFLVDFEVDFHRDSSLPASR